MAPRPVRRQQEETASIAHEAIGVILIAIGVLFGVATFMKTDAVLLTAIKDVSFGILGVFGYVSCLVFIVAGILCIISKRIQLGVGKTLLGILGVLFLFSMVHLCFEDKFHFEDANYFQFIKESYLVGMEQIVGGGVIGALLGYPCHQLLGQVGSMIVFCAGMIIAIMVILNFSIHKASKDLGEKLSDAYQEHREVRQIRREQKWMHENRPLFIDEVESDEPKEPVLKPLDEFEGKHFKMKSYEIESREEADLFGDTEIPETVPAKESKPARRTVKRHPETVPEADGEEFSVPEEPVQTEDQYVKPPVSLLNPSRPKAQGNGREELRQNAQLLEATLRNFGISAKVINVSQGPAVTRYELQPAPGIKVSRIVNLSDDIALNLAAPGIRIEAPIPGKAAIGIEVPNKEVSAVCARELIDTLEFHKLKGILSFAIGKDLAGKNQYGDLAKMPHLLIAGATGSGKSVCVNTLIVSLLYRATPQEVQLIMIDPKQVELLDYNGIPHLRIPVVTDPKKAAGALNWAVNEMVNRYKQFSVRGVKEIEGYNALVRKEGEAGLPKLVIIIDELADLMMTAAREVEDAICRIAQLGRASGIHLVIATQRPSVDVITGLIKANIPSRIALTVSSQVDSRTIIDMAGAEKLLGRGDMLYYPTGIAKPIRIQGCYMTEEEQRAVTDFLKDNNVHSGGYDEACAAAIEQSTESSAISGDENTDPLLGKAIELALEYEQVSISMLQRRMRVGYARAARLVDEMEERGYISPSEGSKPRQVLISWDDYHAIYGGESEEGQDGYEN